MSSGGIRKKLLLLTIVPAMALLVLIFGYFSYQDVGLLRNAMIERGITVARYLAASAEFGVVTGNLGELRKIAGKILQGEIRALRIYDMDDRLLLSDGEVTALHLLQRKSSTEAHLCAENENLLVFCTPISVAPLQVSDFQGGSDVLPEEMPVGRLEVTLATDTLMQKRDESIWRSAWMAFSVLLIALFFARRIELQITRPVLALTETVERVRRGDLKSRLNEDASGELKRLQQGVNSMIKALAEYHDDMETRVASATSQLREALDTLEQKNRDLDVQRQRAETASMAKSQFLATMSHEIRTPLSGMIGMLSLLNRESLDESQHDYVHHLLEAASALRLLIDEILDFSRIEAGKLSIVSQPFTPAGIIDEVVVMLAPSAHQKELELLLDIPPSLPGKVMGDPLRFRQVLINLMGNAIKFTSEGYVLLRVRCQSVSGGKATELMFEIIDTGIGIAQEKLELVFDSFTQVDGSTTRRFGGSGLGTTISRDLVRLMGGEIGVESELGKGSRFWFSLTWPVLELPQEKRQALVGKRVLLFDRQPLSRESMQALLGTLGAEVVPVADEASLQLAIDKQQYDEIMLCENSSEFTQRELAQRLRQTDWGGDAPRLCHVTFINGQSSAELFPCHISKPLTASRLVVPLMRLDGEGADRPEVTTRPLTVLLAEDNAINAKVIIHLLNAAGHHVVHVENGRAALVAMQHEEPDTVLMDVRMPEMDGLTVTRLWRDEEKASGRHLPIIALTANDSREDRQACLAAGMDDFLVKPVSSEQLNAILQRYCCGV